MKRKGRPLLPIGKFQTGRIVRRLNRFVVLVRFDGDLKRAHINNTGRLNEFMTAGREAFLLPGKPGGKTDFRLFAVRDGHAGALFDTQFQMRAVEKALDEGLFPWAEDCRMVRRNPRLGESVMDNLLDCSGNPVYLEVKSAVLRAGRFATYPDCPTLRGQRHILELTEHSASGGRAAILFVCALPEADGFKPFHPGDPEIAPLLRRAQKEGVIIKAVGMQFNPSAGFVEIYHPDLPVFLDE